MSDEIDYKKLYDDLKTESDSMDATYKKEIEILKNNLKDKDDKISELQTYICKNLTTESKPKDSGAKDSFADRYKNALNEMTKGK